MKKRAVRMLLGVLTALAAMKYVTALNFQGDTWRLLGEVDRILESLRGDRWFGWGGQFALLQKLPAMLLRTQGLKPEACLTGLALINLAALVGILTMTWTRVARQSRHLAVVVTVMLLSGPLLWYARTTFGEVLATFCILGLVVACREQAKAWKVFLWFIAAGISKDTIFPFLFVLGLLSSSVAEQPAGGWTFRISRAWLLSFACAITVLLDVSFNYVRFRSPFNELYLDPVNIVPTLSIQLSFFFGLWFSPNGGILFFWPALFFWFVLSGIVAVKVALSAPERRVALLPWVVLVCVTALITAGLSKWYAPFGWVCWGPRLLLPTLPATAYLLTDFYGYAMQRWLAKYILGKGRIWSWAAVLAFVTLPQFGALFVPDTMLSLFGTDAQCPKVAIIQQNADYYYHCINHGLWTKRSVLLNIFSHASLREEFLWTVLCSTMLAVFFGSISMRERAR